MKSSELLTASGILFTDQYQLDHGPALLQARDP